MSRIVRFLGKQHVVFAKLMDTRVRIVFRSVVPESKMAVSRNKIGAEDAPVVLQTTHSRTLAEKSEMLVTYGIPPWNRLSYAPDRGFEIVMLDGDGRDCE